MTSLNGPDLRDPKVMQDLIKHDEAELRTQELDKFLATGATGDLMPRINDANLNQDGVAQRYTVVRPDSISSLESALTDNRDGKHPDALLHLSEGYRKELTMSVQPGFYELKGAVESSLHEINLRLDLISDSEKWVEQQLRLDGVDIPTNVKYFSVYVANRVQEVVMYVIKLRKSKEKLSDEYQFDEGIASKNSLANTFRSIRSSELKTNVFKVLQKSTGTAFIPDSVADMAYVFNKLDIKDESFEIPQVGNLSDVEKFVESLPSIIKNWNEVRVNGVIEMLKLTSGLTQEDKDDRTRILIIAFTSMAHSIGAKADKESDFLNASKYYSKQFKLNEMIKVLKNTLPKESSQVAQ